MIMKLLLVIGVIAFVYFFFIKKKPAVTKPNKQDKNSAAKDEAQSSEMVECSSCGVYSEISDALLSNNKYYCSDECLRKS